MERVALPFTGGTPGLRIQHLKDNRNLETKLGPIIKNSLDPLRRLSREGPVNVESIRQALSAVFYEFKAAYNSENNHLLSPSRLSGSVSERVEVQFKKSLRVELALPPARIFPDALASIAEDFAAKLIYDQLKLSENPINQSDPYFAIIDRCDTGITSVIAGALQNTTYLVGDAGEVIPYHNHPAQRRFLKNIAAAYSIETDSLDSNLAGQLCSVNRGAVIKALAIKIQDIRKNLKTG